MSCTIEIDHRQTVKHTRDGEAFGGAVPKLLAEEYGLPITIKNNATPDYLWTPFDRTYWIESKTWDDFFNSLNDTEIVNDRKVAKVVRQLWTAVRSGADTTLLLEGLPWVNSDGTIRDRKWRESAIDAMLLRLTFRGVSRILLSASAEKSALHIATVYKISHENGTLWPLDALPYTPLPALPLPWIKGSG